MTISLLCGDGCARWDAYVLKNGGSSCYHLSAWKEVLENSFQHKTFYLHSENPSGSIDGVCPLVLMRSRLFGTFMVSLPYFNYGGICADNDAVREELWAAAAQTAATHGAAHLELRHEWNAFAARPVKTAKVSMRAPLPERPEELWNSLPSKVRSQIRRPSKEGMYVVFGREEELESFYHVFSVNMRDLGTPVYGKQFFRNILRAFPDAAVICTVYTREHQPAASGFLISFKHSCEIPWASSIAAYNRFSPNMLLYWKALEYACLQGRSVFDLGRSTPGEGTYRFKEQWGAQPVQLYWHYWLRSGGAMPEINPRNRKYRLAIKFWQRLPVSVTKIIGPPIVKNIP